MKRRRFGLSLGTVTAWRDRYKLRKASVWLTERRNLNPRVRAYEIGVLPTLSQRSSEICRVQSKVVYFLFLAGRHIPVWSLFHMGVKLGLSHDWKNIGREFLYM